MGKPEGLRPAAPAGAPATPLLEARGLCVTPPGADHPAVRGVSLEVRPGEWVALVGENGGGKTSLLHALAGLWPISSGTLALQGLPFGPGMRDAAGAVAAVLQDPSSQILQPTVAEELAFTARNLGMPEDEVARGVARWARAMDLDPDLALDPATCSAGFQQRVLLAAALVARPLLLLADEPTAHIDQAGRTRVRSVIRELTEGGMAVVWATQDALEIGEATRTIEVGRPGAVGLRARLDPGHVPAVGRALGGRVVLRISISDEAPERGPRVLLGRPVEITIGESGVTALTGPNGAGKSVLLEAAAGLEHLPQVVLDRGTGSAQPPIVALQYPELQVFEDLVADELAFAAVSRGMARSAALAEAANHLRALEFDPEALLARRTWSLSTGEKRVVEVVGALIAPAGLVLLDEPTGGLDPARRAALAALVARRALADPVIVASQDLEWLERVGGVRIPLGR